MANGRSRFSSERSRSLAGPTLNTPGLFDLRIQHPDTAHTRCKKTFGSRCYSALHRRATNTSASVFSDTPFSALPWTTTRNSQSENTVHELLAGHHNSLTHHAHLAHTRIRPLQQPPSNSHLQQQQLQGMHPVIRFSSEAGADNRLMGRSVQQSHSTRDVLRTEILLSKHRLLTLFGFTRHSHLQHPSDRPLQI